MIDYQAARRSFEISDHDNMQCALCKGAAAHQDEHYKLGKLRMKMGRDLGLTKEATRGMTLTELLARWHVHLKEERDAKAKRREERIERANERARRQAVRSAGKGGRG